MGFTGREPPFFFPRGRWTRWCRSTNNETGTLLYPTLTQNFHHEIELYGGHRHRRRQIRAADAAPHLGYAVGWT